MKIEVGRRYKVTNLGGASEVVTAEADWQGDVYLRVTIVPSHPRLWLRIGGKAAAPSGLYTIDLLEDRPSGSAVPAPRPFLGDDPGAFDEFRRTFADWDFSTGTY